MGLGPHRSALVEFDGKMYGVSGAELLSVDVNESVVSIGTLDTSGGRVSIREGRNHIALVDGVSGYTYDGTTFAKITDPDFPSNPTHITYLDGCFIVNSENSDQFNISANEDPTAWSSLDFATAAADPDDAEGCIATNANLYLIGSRTTQVYFNSGNLDFPFEVYPNGVLEVGIMAPHSLARAEDNLFMLARTREGGPIVVAVSNFSVSVISDDPGLNWEVDNYTIVDDAIGYAYKQAGNTFYVLTFPAEDKTFVYHLEQAMWHERKGYGIGRWRANTHGFFNNKHWAGDFSTGVLYSLDHNTYKDDAQVIERIRETQVLHERRRRIQVDEIEVEFAPGVGLTTGQGSDPQAMLRFSIDGGKTWSNELWRGIGKVGEFENRSVWRQLGVGFQFNFELKVTDPVPVTVIGAYANIQVLD